MRSRSASSRAQRVGYKTGSEFHDGLLKCATFICSTTLKQTFSSDSESNGARMSNDKRYLLACGGARGEARQPTFVPSSAKQAPRFALAAPQAQLQFSTNVSKSSQRHATRRANELLNFTFAKRERTGEQNAAQPNSRSRRAALKRNVSSYSKEQYLLANCQFAVRHGAPLKDEQVDAPIDWRVVEYVRISACNDEMPHCPICLDAPPTVARITRCGHVYCYVCMLRYLAVSSEKENSEDVASCPICAEPIRERELRIAQLRLVPTYRVGDRLRLVLVRRSKENATRLEPVGSSESETNTELFCKVLRVNTEQLEAVVTNELELVEQERLSLRVAIEQRSKAMAASCSSQNSYAAEFEDLEHQLIFIELACNNLNAQRNAFRNELQRMAKFPAPSMKESTEAERQVEPPRSVQVVSSLQPNRQRYVGAFDDIADGSRKSESELSEPSETSETPVESQTVAEPSTLAVSMATAETSIAGSCVYQSADGQPIFLHSLNVRCLLAQYGDSPNTSESLGESVPKLNEHFPAFLNGVIVQLDAFEMTTELRKRYKHLSHLPLLSHFAIAELDLGSEPGLLDDRVVQLFSAQTEKRKTGRERRALEDRLRAQEAEQLAQERERERRAIFDTSNFPTLGTEVEELSEVNESELHNEETFPQIGTQRTSESYSVSPSLTSTTATTSTKPGVQQPSTTNSVWFRNTEAKAASEAAASHGGRQTFSSLVKSIRENETKYQGTSNAATTNSDKSSKNKPEAARAAVWSKLRTSAESERQRASESGNVDNDEYEMDGQMSLSHFKDAFQHDVDAALMRAFSTLSTGSSASVTADVHASNRTTADAAAAVVTCHHDDELVCVEDTEQRNGKRKKKAEKKAKGTLLFSTNMRRPF